MPSVHPTMRRIRRWRRERARRRRVRHEHARSARYIYTRRARRIACAVPALLASAALVVLLPAAVQSDYGPWSQPATLGACSAPGSPTVVFPSDAPRHGTGPGAIVWSAPPRCPGGGGARVSAIAPGGDVPGAGEIPRTGTGRAPVLTGPLSAAAAPHGRILLAGPTAAGASPARGADGLLFSEGLAPRPFTASTPTRGAANPLALTTAYLGDVALASPGPSGSPSSPGATDGSGRGAIELRIHRYYASSFMAPMPVTASRAVEGLTLAMDYRSDALAVWERDGAIYARDMPGSGRSDRSTQRIAAAAPGARIAALLSDDNRAILAWSETRAGVTRVYAELSGAGVRFGVPRLLERYADPGGFAPPSGSPRLVRLLSESVMLAWTGAASGHWVVGPPPGAVNGVGTIDTISTPGRDALLADLAPGPAGEAYALWSEPQATPSGLDLGEEALYAARGIDAYPGRTIFGPPEQVSAPGASGATGEAAVGVDPDSDRAIVAWRTPGGAIDYSLSALGGG
jgi:hypothetical protein